MFTQGFGGRRPQSDVEGRIPSGQTQTTGFPVLSIGPTPRVDLTSYEFEIYDGDEKLASWDWKALNEIKKTDKTWDIHCVTRWTKLDTKWQGIMFDDLFEAADIDPPSDYVMFHCKDGYTTNVPVEYLIDEGAMLATMYEGDAVTPDHGGPIRVVLPKLYFWKSPKWVNRMTFMDEDAPGFWEVNGYHMLGDPFQEQRFRGD